jgi:hypothetical protein
MRKDMNPRGGKGGQNILIPASPKYLFCIAKRGEYERHAVFSWLTGFWRSCNVSESFPLVHLGGTNPTAETLCKFGRVAFDVRETQTVAMPALQFESNGPTNLPCSPTTNPKHIDPRFYLSTRM